MRKRTEREDGKLKWRGRRDIREKGQGIQKGQRKEEGKGKEKWGGGVAFSNVAGLRNKDKECLKGLGKWKVMVLMET